MNPVPVFAAPPRRPLALALALTALLCLAALAGCRSAFWSPDGRTIALDVSGRLRLFDRAGRKFTVIETGGRYVVNPSFSPEGKRIAYYGITIADRQPQRVDIWVQDLAAGSERRVAAEVVPPTGLGPSTVPGPPTGGPGGAGGPAAPPDPIVELAMQIKMTLAIAWSPDGGRIAHTRALRESGDIEIVDVAGGAAVNPVARVGQLQLFPAWSPNGRSLAWFELLKPASGSKSGETLVELYVADADGTNPQRRWDSKTQAEIFPFFAPVWSADSTRLAVLTEIKKVTDLSEMLKMQVQVVPAAGGEPSILTTLATPFGSVAPNLKAVAYIGGRDDATVEFRAAPFTQSRVLDKIPSASRLIRAGGARPEGGSVFPTVSLSPDGKTAAFVNELPAGKGHELRLYDTATGKGTIFSLETGAARAVAPIAPPPTARMPAGKAAAAGPKATVVRAVPGTPWKMNLDIRGRPAREVLRAQAKGLGLALEESTVQDGSLDRALTLNLRGKSRFEVIEEVCSQLQIYPVYGEGALLLAPGPRPYPAAFAGPFFAVVEGMEPFPDHAAGAMQVRVLAAGLPPGALRLMKDASDPVRVESALSANGEELYDEQIGAEDFSVESTFFETNLDVPLKNLLRTVTAIRSMRIQAGIAAPVQTETARFAHLKPGSGVKAGPGRVVLKKLTVGATTGMSFETKGLALGRVEFTALDARGRALKTERNSAYGNSDTGMIEITVQGRPSAVVARAITEVQELEFPITLADIPLPAEKMPARLDPLRHDGHPAPVTVEFLKIVGSEDFPKLQVRITNRSNKDLRRMDVRLHSRDADGKVIHEGSSNHGTSRTTPMKEPMIALRRGASEEVELMAFFTPKEAKRVDVILEQAIFSDATEWKAAKE